METLNKYNQAWLGNYSFKNKLIAAGCIIALLFTAAFFPFWKINAKQGVDAGELIYLTNQERVKNNLPTLKNNRQLEEAAKNKAEAILQEQYFSHNLPEGGKFSNWVKEVNYQYMIVGENLAAGFGTSEAVIKAWMESEKHRQNILNSQYKEVGLAVVKGKLENKSTYVIVQYLGATANILISENLPLYKEGLAVTIAALS